ncbi:MAG: hypothetical protein AAGF75_04650 [Cyanobacteria bacterium P01_H01_bin.130]
MGVLVSVVFGIILVQMPTLSAQGGLPQPTEMAQAPANSDRTNAPNVSMDTNAPTSVPTNAPTNAPTGPDPLTVLYEQWRERQIWGGVATLILGGWAIALVFWDIKRQPVQRPLLPPMGESVLKYADVGLENAVGRLRRDGDSEFQVASPAAKFTLELSAAIAGTSLPLALAQWISLWHPSIGAWLIFFGPILLLVWVFAWVFWRDWVMQAWTAHHHGGKREGPFFCSTCDHPMRALPQSQLLPYLTPRERKLEEVRAVEWKAYHCDRCCPPLTDPLPLMEDRSPLLPTMPRRIEEPREGDRREDDAGPRWFHLRALEQSRLGFTVCPKCNEKALKLTAKVLREPTVEREGELESTVDCQMCGHHDVAYRSIAKKPRHVKSYG